MNTAGTSPMLTDALYSCRQYIGWALSRSFLVSLAHPCRVYGAAGTHRNKLYIVPACGNVCTNVPYLHYI